MIWTPFLTRSSYALFPLWGSFKYLSTVGFAAPSSVPLPFPGCTATSPCTVHSSPPHSVPSAHCLKLRWEMSVTNLFLLKLLNHSCVKQLKPQFCPLPLFLPSTNPWSSFFLFPVIFQWLFHFSSATYCSHPLCNLLDFSDFIPAGH